MRHPDGFLLDYETSQASKLLEKLFANHFINCRSWSVSETPDGFESYPDLEHLYVYSSSFITSTDALFILFEILQRNAFPLTALRLTKVDDTRTHEIDKNRLPMSVVTSPGFRAAMSSIVDLTLDFSLNVYTWDEDYFTREIVTSIIKLRSLSIRYSTPSIKLIQILHSSEKCRFLQSLQLSYFVLSSDNLLQLLRCCYGTLRSLKLNSVILEEPAHLKPQNSWKNLLRPNEVRSTGEYSFSSFKT